MYVGLQLLPIDVQNQNLSIRNSDAKTNFICDLIILHRDFKNQLDSILYTVKKLV